VTAGIGMNVANAAPPFASLADAAAAAGGDRARAALSPRRALAVLCNTLEPALDTLMQDGFTKELSDQYHAAWLHSGQRVTVDGGDSVVIERLSDAGFLRGVADDGQAVELHPDANSLDLFQGLVRRK
jgi:biotin---protein ligase